MTKYKITMDELLEIIKNKKQNAENDLSFERSKIESGFIDLDKIQKLKGEINAYTDLICLIESKKG